MQVLLTTTLSWHLPHTARAFHERKALAGLWMADKNSTQLPGDRYQRCWPYHLMMKPFYHLTPRIWRERATYRFQPVYQQWLARRLRRPEASRLQVIQAIMGIGSEAFNHADRIGALKVVDCANSHPTTLYGYWQRECDLWCPGERVPIPRRIFARMNRELQRADLVIVQSIFSKESMVSNGIPADKVMINPMGIDPKTFAQRREVPARPRFTCVATICLRKGHQYLFRAFQKVKAALPDAELVCVGDYKCDFRKERPKWEGAFTHHPQLTQQQIAALFQTTTAFVFPSQEEGIARAQIEALGSGIPVIGTFTAGTTTVVDDGKEGFIVPGNNPDQIAQRMIQLAQDRELNRRMGEAAFNRCNLGNTWQDYGDRLLAEFDRRLAQR